MPAAKDCSARTLSGGENALSVDVIRHYIKPPPSQSPDGQSRPAPTLALKFFALWVRYLTPQAQSTRMEDDQRDSEREPLDYSSSSTAAPQTVNEYDAKIEDNDPYSDHTTTFDVPPGDDTVRRFGKTYQKHQWLSQLNSGREDTNRQAQRRHRNRIDDLQQMIDVTECHQHHQNALLDTVTDYYRIIDDSDSDFQFGSRPIEVTELALLTLAARTVVSVSGFEELDDGNPLHSLATDGAVVERLTAHFLPDDTDCTREDIRSVRHPLRQILF